ncbi:unnamed protein product [Ixodes pacificus]
MSALVSAYDIPPFGRCSARALALSPLLFLELYRGALARLARRTALVRSAVVSEGTVGIRPHSIIPFRLSFTSLYYDPSKAASLNRYIDVGDAKLSNEVSAYSTRRVLQGGGARGVVQRQHLRGEVRRLREPRGGALFGRADGGTRPMAVLSATGATKAGPFLRRRVLKTARGPGVVLR